MILGDVCTRPCGFCAVKRGRPEAVALDEPDRLAEACHRLGLRHVVITSVTRDDLPDGGAEHFARCIEAVRRRTGATIEVLTPDFDGRTERIDRVLAARPEVFNHNVETVARLQQQVRRKSRYEVSLAVLAHAKRTRPETFTKSGLMLGLGEIDRGGHRDDGRPPVDRLRLPDDRAVLAALSGPPAGRPLPAARRVRRAGPHRAGNWASRRSPAGRSSARATMPTRWRAEPSGSRWTDGAASASRSGRRPDASRIKDPRRDPGRSLPTGRRARRPR